MYSGRLIEKAYAHVAGHPYVQMLSRNICKNKQNYAQ